MRGIVLAEFGSRETEIRGVIKNIRTISNLPIVIYSDKRYDFLGLDVTVKLVVPGWVGHRRYFNRNNDYWKVVAAKEFDEVLIIDDDMRIVNDRWVEGFEIAEKFGVCLPMNPRIYFGLDRQCGDDTSDDLRNKTGDCPYHLTGNNMGVIFANTNHLNTRKIFNTYLDFMEKEPCRGPVAMGVAYWRCGRAPYFLPEEWCACGGYTSFKSRSRLRINPMFLHIGHKDVLNWFNTENSFERFRK